MKQNLENKLPRIHAARSARSMFNLSVIVRAKNNGARRTARSMFVLSY